MNVGWMPSRVFGAPGADLRRVAALADDAGVDHLAVGDHVSFFVGAGGDGLGYATAMLALSDRLSVNTGVYLLPLRHPTTVARQLSDMAALAPGRFVFGVGIGGEDPHEVEICGVDPSTRGRRMNECIQVVRGLLTGEPFDFDGEFFALSRAYVLPAPADPIPIVVGGRSDAAVRRAGRLGDGWFGVWVSARRYREVVDEMHAHAAEAGRDGVQWRNVLNVWCGVDDSRESAREHLAPAMHAFYQLPFERFEKWSPYGTAEDLAGFLAPYAEAGCHDVNMIINGPDLEAEAEAVAEVRRLLS